MTQDCLSSLSLLLIQQKTARKMNSIEMIDTFAESKARKNI